MTMLAPPLRPKNGSVAQVIIVCRVSDPGPGKQDLRSLDDQTQRANAYLQEHLDIPYESTVVAGSGSGENISREEYIHLIELVDSKKFDLVITEDLGRIVRRIQAHLFAESCVDADTRLIALNDYIDTAVPGWQDRSIFAAWHHERSNRDTSERIKRSHLGRFRDGGCAQFPIYGIIKPPGSRNDSEWRKDPEAEPIVQEIARMLDADGNYSAVADWLNERGIEPGPLCRIRKWNGAMVRRFIHNPILRGMRYRNKKKSRRGADGRYRCVDAAAHEIVWRKVPHLAFFEADYHVALLSKLDARNALYRKRKEPQKRTRFPGQSIHCGICGRMYVFGGHGQTDRLMCDGAREYKCWNGVTIDGPLTTQKILSGVYQQISQLPDFDAALIRLVHEEADRLDIARQGELEVLRRRCQQLDTEISRLVAFVEQGGELTSVRERLGQKEKELSLYRAKERQLATSPRSRIEIPTIETLRAFAKDELSRLETDSWQFQRMMKRLIPRIVVFPVQSVDGGQPVCRATFRLQLGNLLPESPTREALAKPIERIVTVELFEPPQRILHLTAIKELRNAGFTEKQVAQQLGITVTAAQRSSALARRMSLLGLTDPYQPLKGPTDMTPKLVRHRHTRYRFESLPDAGKV